MCLLPDWIGRYFYPHMLIGFRERRWGGRMRERWGGRESEREKHRCERETSVSSRTCTDQGWNPHPSLIQDNTQ